MTNLIFIEVIFRLIIKTPVFGEKLKHYLVEHCSVRRLEMNKIIM